MTIMLKKGLNTNNKFCDYNLEFRMPALLNSLVMFKKIEESKWRLNSMIR